MIHPKDQSNNMAITIYTPMSSANVHVYVSESEDDGIHSSDDQFWNNFFKPNISCHIYQDVINYSIILGINELNIINELSPLKPRETKSTSMDHDTLKPFFAYLLTLRIKKSFEHCFHYMQIPTSGYLRSRHCSPNPAANFYCQSEIDCTVTMFGDVPAVDNGATASQLWVGQSLKFTTVHELKGLTEEDVLLTLQDQIQNHRTPEHITANNALVYHEPEFSKYLRDLWIQLW